MLFTRQCLIKKKFKSIYNTDRHTYKVYLIKLKTNIMQGCIYSKNYKKQIFNLNKMH